MSDILIQPTCRQCGYVLFISEELIIEHPETEHCTFSNKKYKVEVVSELLIHFLFKTIGIKSIEVKNQS